MGCEVGTEIGSAMARSLDVHGPDIIARYREELFRAGNPLAVDEQIWRESAQQARAVLADCVLALELGRRQTARTAATQVADHGRRRASAGISPRYAVVAGTVLFEIVMDRLVPAAEGRPEGAEQIRIAAEALQQSISSRLETAVVGYDQVLLERINRLQSGGQRSLARAIHDELGNTISLAMRHLELYEHLTPGPAKPADAQLVAAKQALVDSMQGIRDIVTSLRRDELAGSLEQALKLFVASVGGTRPEIEVRVTGDEAWAPQHVLVEVFLAVRECLRNSLSHADADWIWADVTINPHSIGVSVVDDGVGFDVTAALEAGANGLTSVTERVELLGGVAAISGIPSVGTRVTMSIPLPEWADGH
ncbi:histidine kinase [Kitasatospora atroaurantiaca]|uniref:Histidine kinase n=2 Tax=Kitasatospora atroaurantiaca TaxID=285545 RepID=A0A561ENQ1_9ACTN|nr:histidine kinase [Kitasatospora atroaurantiaca]